MTIPIKYLFKNLFIQGVLFLLFLWMLWNIRFILVIIFIAFIISSAIHPVATFLQKKKFPTWLSVTVPYVALVAILVVLILPMIPFLVKQSTQFIASFPAEVERAGKIIGVHISLLDIQDFLRSRIETISTSALSFTLQTLGFLFASFVTIFMSVYFLLDRRKVQSTISSFFSSEDVPLLIERIEEQIGAWARGQIILSFSIALANFLAYIIIGIPYALPLAVLAGLLEIIPNIGPTIAAVPAVIIGLTISFSKALLVLGVFILIQILEGNFLVPRIMQRAVGLHPIVVTLAILIGGELLGIPGALISIPFASLLTVIWKQLLENNKSSNEYFPH